jgi:hypothetical protein
MFCQFFRFSELNGKLANIIYPFFIVIKKRHLPMSLFETIRRDNRAISCGWWDASSGLMLEPRSGAHVPG